MKADIVKQLVEDYEGRRVTLFVGAVSVAGLAVFGLSIEGIVAGPFNAQWLLFFFVTLLISGVDIGIPKTATSLTPADTFILVSLLLFGAAPSVVLAGVGAAIASVQYRTRRMMVLFNLGALSLSAWTAGTVVNSVLGSSQPLDQGIGALLLAAGFLAVIYYGLSTGLTALLTLLNEAEDPATETRKSLIRSSLKCVGSAVAAGLIVRLVGLVSFYAIIVAAPVLTVTYVIYKIYLDKIESSNVHVEQLADLHLRTIEALAIAIDAKDEVTHNHVRRVQIYATGLARLFGLSEGEIEALRAGALLHDIGKLAVPDYILNKPGDLTPAEYDKMKVHTTVGAEILERVGFPYPVVPVIRHHHERWDGRGHPDGLRGDQIPITARILTVTDCFDAVREDRHYRKALSREQAVAMLKEGSGTVFDPTVVGVFLDHLEGFEAEVREQGVDRYGNASPFQKRPETNRLGDPGQPPLESIRGAHREVIALYGIAQMVGNMLDVRDMFAVFTGRLLDIVSYTTCVLYLVKSDSTHIEAGYVTGLNAERIKGRRIASGAGIAGWVIANRHAMHNSDPRLDFDALKVDIQETYKTATVVPLVKNGQPLGALALYSTDLTSYESDHLTLVEAVGNLAADAIANADHSDKDDATALTDELTGLPNARALRYRFEEEAERARRHKDTFTVVMSDLDGFRKVNEQIGHQAADHVLRETAQAMLRLVRSSDFACRYSSDEFVFVLQSGVEEVQELVRRIQRTVASRNVGIPGLELFVGVSAGWACFGADGDALDTLLIVADRAMHANKARRKAALAESKKPATSDLEPRRIM